MKKLFTIGIIIFLFTSCNNINNSFECLKTIKKQFPNSSIYSCEDPNDNHMFYVYDSTGLKIVRCNYSSEIYKIIAVGKLN